MVSAEQSVELLAGEETFPSVALSTTTLIWPDLGPNPGRRGGKPAANHLSHLRTFGVVLSS
jgi:hypothetical protein